MKLLQPSVNRQPGLPPGRLVEQNLEGSTDQERAGGALGRENSENSNFECGDIRNNSKNSDFEISNAIT